MCLLRSCNTSSTDSVFHLLNKHVLAEALDFCLVQIWVEFVVFYGPIIKHGNVNSEIDLSPSVNCETPNFCSSHLHQNFLPKCAREAIGISCGFNPSSIQHFFQFLDFLEQVFFCSDNLDNCVSRPLIVCITHSIGMQGGWSL